MLREESRADRRPRRSWLLAARNHMEIADHDAAAEVEEVTDAYIPPVSFAKPSGSREKGLKLCSNTLIVERIDHVMTRVVPSAYERLFSLFADTLGLPIAGPVSDAIPGFKTGGVCAGNINIEVFQSGAQGQLDSPEPSLAQLYGIAFEPSDLPAAMREVDQRGIAHLPAVPVPEGRPLGTIGSMWTLLIFGNVLGSDLSRYGTAMRGATDLSPFFTTVFRNGMAFLCEYTPAFIDTAQRRRQLQAELRTRDGGPLGLEGVQEVVIGARDVQAAERDWQHLLDPIGPVSPGVWRFEDGPALRLIPASHDGLVRLVWKVATLGQAKTFLIRQDMLGAVMKQRISIAPQRLFGLDIQLSE